MNTFRSASWYRLPIIVAIAQALVISLVANSIAQFIVCIRSRHWKYDVVQTLRFFALSLVLVPMNYNWEIWLEWMFPTYYQVQREVQLPLSRSDNGGKSDTEVKLVQYRDSTQDMGTALQSPTISSQARAAEPTPPTRLHVVNTIIKLVLDAFTIGIFANILVILVVMGFLKGQNKADIAADIRAKTVSMVIDSFKLWPAATVVAYVWIKVEKRVVFFQFVGLLWGIYISLVVA